MLVSKAQSLTHKPPTSPLLYNNLLQRLTNCLLHTIVYPQPPTTSSPKMVISPTLPPLDLPANILQSSPPPTSPPANAPSSGTSTARPSSPPGGAKTAIRRKAAADRADKVANARPTSTRAAGAGGSSSTMLREWISYFCGAGEEAGRGGNGMRMR